MEPLPCTFTTSVSKTFDQIFRREGVSAAFVEGDAFHRYDRAEMRQRMAEETARGNHHFSHFGPQTNLFEQLDRASLAAQRRLTVPFLRQVLSAG